MIHSIKKDLYWSFWCQGWSNHQDWYFFWWNEAVKVIEATEVVEAVEVTETAEILRSGKSLLRTSESSRFLNSALFWCLERNNFLYDHEISYWNLAPFLSEAVEASQCYFFENWLMKLKCPILLKPLDMVSSGFRRIGHLSFINQF